MARAIVRIVARMGNAVIYRVSVVFYGASVEPDLVYTVAQM
jgi:hypothetical protein